MESSRRLPLQRAGQNAGVSQPAAARKATTKGAAAAATSPRTWPHPCGAFLAAVTTSLPRPWARLLLAGVQVAERSWAAIVSSLQAQRPGSAVRTRDLQRGASLLAVGVAGPPCQARCVEMSSDTPQRTAELAELHSSATIGFETGGAAIMRACLPPRRRHCRLSSQEPPLFRATHTSVGSLLPIACNG